MNKKLKNAEYITDDLLTPILYGGNDIIEDYTKKIIILEKWHDMMVEMYYEPFGDICDFEGVYKKTKEDIENNFRKNLGNFLREEGFCK